MECHSSLNRPPMLIDNTNIYVRASVSGSCIRALTGLRMGYSELTPPPWLTEAANQGHLCEQWYKDTRRACGAVIVYEQLGIKLPVPNTRVILTGHIDGIEYDYSEWVEGLSPHLLEVKSMSGRQFRKWLKHSFTGFPKYKSQISIYSTVLDLPIKYVVINRASKDKKGDYRELNITYLPLRPFNIEDVFTKMQRMEEYAKNNLLPECDPGMQYCLMNNDICKKGDR